MAVLISLDVDHRMFKEKEGQKSCDRHKLSKCEKLNQACEQMVV